MTKLEETSTLRMQLEASDQRHLKDLEMIRYWQQEAAALGAEVAALRGIADERVAALEFALVHGDSCHYRDNAAELYALQATIADAGKRDTEQTSLRLAKP